MTELTPDDVHHWDVSLIYQMFDAATRIHNADKTLGESVENVRARTQWHGEAGDAFRTDLGKDIKHIDADGHLSKGVATAVSNAEDDVKYCRTTIDDIYEDAEHYGWTVTNDWRIDDSNANEEGQKHDSQLWQNSLTMLKARAVAADHELGVALRAAVGDTQVDESGHEVNPPRDVGSQERPGVTDVNDHDLPGQGWQPGFHPEEWKQSWQNPKLADNPPGYTGGKEGRDQAWKEYLAHFPREKDPVTGKIPRGYLPNPDAVDDPGLKVVGNGATQLGTSYAWGGKGLSGPGKGTLSHDPEGGGAHIYGDDHRIGFDCSGLAEYAAAQTRPGIDIGAGTGNQKASPDLTNVTPGMPLQPGDFVYYTHGPEEHVGIYVAPGVILNAPESGLPVQLDQRTTAPNGDAVRVRRLP